MPDCSYLKLPLDQLPDPLPIPVVERPFHVTVTPPGSKSLTNRALLLAALADGESVLRGALTEADDARVMIAAVEKLGAIVNVGPDEVRIVGVGGRWRPVEAGLTLNLQNAGTATRFLAAAAILAPPALGPVIIDGNARMRERPIGDLGDQLRALGVRVEYHGKQGNPPVEIYPPTDLSVLSDTLRVGAAASSQFVSALALVAPFLPRGLRLVFDGAPPSLSYFAMTLGLLRELGVACEGEAPDEVRIGTAARGAKAGGAPAPPGLFRFEYDVEPDASGAGYFWAAAAMGAASSSAIPGLNMWSLQGDVGLATVLGDMGARVESEDDRILVRGPVDGLLEPVIASMHQMPDAAMTLGAACCFAPGRSVLSGLRTLRVKETDRLAAVRTELSKVGVIVCIGQETAEGASGRQADERLVIQTPRGGIDCSAGVQRVEFDTYDDHRMAMSLALIGLRRPNVFIRNPKCVAKTYPEFWRDFAKFYDG